MLNVNRQFAHRGGKMRGVIQSHLRAAGYALMPLTPMPFAAQSPMLRPDALPEADFPVDCVARYPLPGGRRHLVCVDAHGVTFEERIVFAADDTQAVEDDMLERMRAKARPSKLTLVTPSSSGPSPVR